MTLNQNLFFSQHPNLVMRSCYYQLRQLLAVLRFLSHNEAVALVHVLYILVVLGCAKS